MDFSIIITTYFAHFSALVWFTVPSREIIWISSTNYKPQASLHQQQLNVLFSYYKSPSKLLPSLSHPDRFIISPNQFILGQTIVSIFRTRNVPKLGTVVRLVKVKQNEIDHILRATRKPIAHEQRETPPNVFSQRFHYKNFLHYSFTIAPKSLLVWLLHHTTVFL